MFACPACKQAVYGWKEALSISAVTPGRCPVCAQLAGSSWWNLAIALPIFLLPIFGFYLSLVWSTWVPITLAVLASCALWYVQIRFIPFAITSTREVFWSRVIGALLFVGLVGGVLLDAVHLASS